MQVLMNKCIFKSGSEESGEINLFGGQVNCLIFSLDYYGSFRCCSSFFLIRLNFLLLFFLNALSSRFPLRYLLLHKLQIPLSLRIPSETLIQQLHSRLALANQPMLCSALCKFLKFFCTLCFTLLFQLLICNVFINGTNHCGQYLYSWTLLVC